jgi:UDP-N-acetylglucosamine transferase subunit ALG13
VTRPRIVAIVGTKGAFLRLTDLLAAYARAHPEASIWVQHGQGPLPRGLPNLDGASLVQREVLLSKMRDADAIVCHAGSGTIRDALELGFRPIVVPRLARFGEHVNDHQLELVSALNDRIIGLREPTPEGFAEALDLARTSRGKVGAEGGEALKAALRADLETLVETSRPRRLLSHILALATFWVPRKTHRWDPPDKVHR